MNHQHQSHVRVDEPSGMTQRGVCGIIGLQHEVQKGEGGDLGRWEKSYDRVFVRISIGAIEWSGSTALEQDCIRGQ